MIKDFSHENGKKSGVYKITHIKTGKVYIGSTIKFNKRYKAHILDFVKNKNSKYMQNVFNKNKNLNEFIMCIVEIVNDKKLLPKHEQEHLNKYYDDCKNCFNIAPIAGSCFGIKHTDEFKINLSINKKDLWNKKEYRNKMLELNKLNRKYYEFVSPKNKLYCGYGIEKFCKKHNLHISHMGELLNSKLKSHKGWRIKKNIDYVYDTKKHCQKIGYNNIAIYDVLLKSPNGKIFGPINNLKKFCFENKLHRVSIRKLIKKEIKQTKGWTLLQEELSK